MSKKGSVKKKFNTKTLDYDLLHQRIAAFQSTKHKPIYNNRRLDLELATALRIWNNPLLDDDNYMKQAAYNGMMRILDMAEETA
jgi:hypothetical protein